LMPIITRYLDNQFLIIFLYDRVHRFQPKSTHTIRMFPELVLQLCKLRWLLLKVQSATMTIRTMRYSVILIPVSASINPARSRSGSPHVHQNLLSIRQLTWLWASLTLPYNDHLPDQCIPMKCPHDPTTPLNSDTPMCGCFLPVDLTCRKSIRPDKCSQSVHNNSSNSPGVVDDSNAFKPLTSRLWPASSSDRIAMWFCRWFYETLWSAGGGFRTSKITPDVSRIKKEDVAI
jgi:hypothetical protein